MLKNTKDIIKKKAFFSDYSYGSHKSYIVVRSGWFRLIYDLQRNKLLGKFQPDSFKTERLVCIETDGQTDRRTWLHVRLSVSTQTSLSVLMLPV